MRFFERALKALGYHRRAYAIGLLWGVLFSSLSLALLNARSLNVTGLHIFKARLKGFGDNVAVAKPLISGMTKAYCQLNRRFDQSWLILVAAMLAVMTISAIIFSYMRRSETNAYVLVGKSSADIVSQYVIESLLVFTAGFAITLMVLTLFSDLFTNALVKFNNWALNRQLISVPETDFNRIIKALFKQRVTEFSGDTLFFPHHGPNQPHPDSLRLIGALRTYLSGLAILAVSQSAVFSIAVSGTRRGLIKR